MHSSHNAAKAYDYAFSNLFHPGSNLFYDYRISKEPDGLTVHLPSPDYIHDCIPTPCGWGSGMENSI